jgi:hypothetical protein
MVRVIAAVVFGLTMLRRMNFRYDLPPDLRFTPQNHVVPKMTTRVFLGMLTPSSNTILEPVTTAMLAGLPEVTAHFSRFKVTEIALSGPALAQFDDSEILRAAELLAHAKVNVIAWNGTSSGWLGFERDVQLCERIKQATGIPACTAMLALNEILEITARSASASSRPISTTCRRASMRITRRPATRSRPTAISAFKTIFRFPKSPRIRCAG